MPENNTIRECPDGNVGITLGSVEYIRPRQAWIELLGKVEDDQSKERQRDEDDFLAHIRFLIKYWADLPDVDKASGHIQTTERRISGCAFSIMTYLDGCTGPSYAVRRRICDGETGELEREGPDFSGSLHEMLQYHDREPEDVTN